MKPNGKGKIKSISKFNTPIEVSPFLRNFQYLLLEKMIMIKAGTYSKVAMDKAIMKIFQYPTHIKMDIDPILVSCQLEPDLYFEIQETIKKLTGDVMPMDELIYMLLTYMVRCYGGKYQLKKFQPFMRVNPSGRLKKLAQFKLRMRKYFKNHVPIFPEQIDNGDVLA